MVNDIEAELDALLGAQEETTDTEGVEAEAELPVDSTDPRQALAETISSLTPEQQELVEVHLTPEIVEVIGLLFGDNARQILSEVANPEVLLVPVPREQALAEAQAEQSAGVPAQAAAPAQPAQEPVI